MDRDRYRWIIIEEFVAQTCIRGYRVYRRIWSATIGEKLVCKREISNVVERYAVSVLKHGQLLVIFLRMKVTQMDQVNLS